MPTDYNITAIQLPNGDKCHLPNKVKYIDITKSGSTYSLPSGTTYASIKALIDTDYLCIVRVDSPNDETDGKMHLYLCNYLPTASSSPDPEWDDGLFFQSRDYSGQDFYQVKIYSNSTVSFTAVGCGNYISKVSSTDNAIVRFDGTSGDVQNSGVIIDDNNNVKIPAGSNTSAYQNPKLEIGGKIWVGTGASGGIVFGGISGSSYSTYYTFDPTALRVTTANSGVISLGTSTQKWKNLFMTGNLYGASNSIVVDTLISNSHTHSNKTVLDYIPSSLGTAGQIIAVTSGATGLEWKTPLAIGTTATTAAAGNHAHGNITNTGTITSDTAIGNGDKIVVVDGNDNKVQRSPITFDGSTTTKYLSPSGTWVNVPAGTLAGLSDTTISLPSNGQVLTYNGSAWVNSTPAADSDEKLALSVVPDYLSSDPSKDFSIIVTDNSNTPITTAKTRQYTKDLKLTIDNSEAEAILSVGGYYNIGKLKLEYQSSGGCTELATDHLWFNDSSNNIGLKLYTNVNEWTNYQHEVKIPYKSGTIALTSDLPAAQVNSDWNSSSGVSQILNKPTLATVATSGSYNDLSNKPTIPTNSDFSLSGLSDTTVSSPSNGQVLTYNGTSGKWVNTSLSNGYFTVNHIIKSYTEFQIDSNHLSDGDVAWSLSNERFYTFDLYNSTWNEDASLNAQVYDGMIIYSIIEGAFYIYNINESLKAISKGTPVITEANDGESNFEQCIYLPVCDSSGDIYITSTSHVGSDYYLIIYGLYGTETCPLEQCGSDHVITIFNTTNNDMTYTLQGDLYIGGEYDNIMSGVDDTTNSFVVPAGGVAEVNVHVTKYENNGAYAGGILNIIVKTDSVWNKTTN